MNIIISNDHAGVELKNNVKRFLEAKGYTLKEIAELIRKHNNANVLSLPARFISTENALEIVKVFLETHFEEGGWHERRVAKIDK